MKTKHPTANLIILSVVAVFVCLIIAFALASMSDSMKDVDPLPLQMPPQAQVLFVDSVYNLHAKTNVLEVPLDYDKSKKTTLCYVGEGGALTLYELPSENVTVKVDPDYFGLPQATIGQMVEIVISTETKEMFWPRF